ncbi:MAG TPA: capreomycidine synthase [Thermoanaerobaculia bacterium]|nr:capreomycidine synthase [Thermoanaerobaculia bacterium]
MKLAPALLERWMREYYFAVEIDIGGSGVEDFSLGELRRLLTGLEQNVLDRLVFHDSLTLGGADLRRAISERWGDGSPERVMATHGSSEAIYLIMNALLQAGDEVVVLDPCYPQLHLIAQGIGCHVKKWRLRFEDEYAPDLDALEELLGSGTRMVVVNFPHNPTGTSLSPEQHQRLLAIVARTGAYLVWDNAFGELTYEHDPLPDPILTYERAISMGTLSKAFGLPGLRVGWCLAAPVVLQQLVHLRDYVTLHLSPLIELIATRVIEECPVLIGIRLEQARKNLEILAMWMAAHDGLIEWARPHGGVCTFPRINGLADTEEFCHRMAQSEKTLLVPGNCFEHPQHVRLGFGGPHDVFREGLSRLSRMLHAVAEGSRPAMVAAVPQNRTQHATLRGRGVRTCPQ